MDSPPHSLTTSMQSINGGQVPVLPAIGSGHSSLVSNKGLPESNSLSTQDTGNSQHADSDGSMTASRNVVSKRNSFSANIQSNNLLRYIHSHLQRKKTLAKFDTAILPNLDT